MKRFYQLIVVFFCVLLLSGCVKEHFSMKINKDKSMNLEVEVMLSDEFIEKMSEDGESNEMTDAASEAEKKGFKITQKKENGYSGYLITRTFDNIDELSKNNGEEVNIGNMFEDNFDFSKLFKKEKGLIKDTYIAKFTFDNSSENPADFGDDDEDFTLVEDDEVVTTEALNRTEADMTTTDIETEEDEEYSDLMNLAAQMEMTYKVTLPYGAKSNNATSVNDKTLTWDLVKTNNPVIEYSFEMYNMTGIILIAAGVVALIIIIIVITAMIKKKKATKETLIHTDYDSSIVGKIDEANNPIEEIGNTANNLEYNNPQEQVPQASVVDQTPSTPTMQAPETVATPVETNQFVLPQEPNVTQGPQVTNTQNVELDVPQMTEFSNMDQNNLL